MKIGFCHITEYFSEFSRSRIESIVRLPNLTKNDVEPILLDMQADTCPELLARKLCLGQFVLILTRR